MPDVLDWVASLRVVVKGWSYEFLRELTLQDCFEERGTGDFGSGLFQSTTELHLCFLGQPLDQLVEGLDVGELLDLPLSLVMRNSRLKMRRISFVVRTSSR